MTESLRSQVLRWFDEVYNQGRFETIDELLAPEAVIHGVGLAAGPVRGASELKEQVEVLRGAFPDLHIRVEELICEGRLVAMRLTASGTHRGDELGISPTRRRVTIEGMSFGRWEGGQLVEGWNQFDLFSLYRQLGVLSLFSTAGPDEPPPSAR